MIICYSLHVRILLILLALSFESAVKTNDFKGLSFLDQNFRVGLGMSYSKLETNSAIGNYYLLSAANPRIDLAYDTGAQDFFRQRFSVYVVRELFRPENDALIVKSKQEQTNYGLSWQPMWVTEGEGFSYGLKLGAKAATIVSELPTTFTVNGDVATRYSAEGGVCFNWFGQTVTKFPLNVGLELLYSQGLLDNSVITYRNGFIYRFSFEFDFKKKTLFSGWNIKGFYSFEDIENSYSHFVDKELGLTINKVFTF